MAYDRDAIAKGLRDGRALTRTTIGTDDGAERYVFVDRDSVVVAQLHPSGRLRSLERRPLAELDRVVAALTPFEMNEDPFALALPSQLRPLIVARDAYDWRMAGALADDETWLPLVWERGHLRRSAAVGLEVIFVDDAGAPNSRRICYDQAISRNLDREFFEQPERQPEPVVAPVLASLRHGERVHAETLAALRGGTIGWRIHIDLLVVCVDGDWYNTEFAGDAAISFTRFNEIGASNFVDTVLTDATTGNLARCIHPVTPAQLASLRERVGTPPDEILARLAAGELSLVGGGPTTDMMWSLARVGDRYVQRGDFGERELGADDVERIVRQRHYHSARVVPPG